MEINKYERNTKNDIRPALDEQRKRQSGNY